MKELSDKDFDQVFKNKIKDGYLEYEEASWLKMEKKLRKRDRFVFFRNASIILLFLSFGIGLYVKNGKKIATDEGTAKKIEILKKVENGKADDLQNEIQTAKNGKALFSSDESKTQTVKTQLFSNKNLAKNDPITPIIVSNIEKSTDFASKSAAPIADKQAAIDSTTRITQRSITSPNSQSIINQGPKNAAVKRSKLPITLSIQVGPDFSSTKNAIGGKSGMAMGIGISLPLSKKLSLQTGINYGSKNYKAHGYDYTFNNPNIVNIIASIEAACKVLEIPLIASYTIMDNQKSSIDLNAGLSSYMMLKENYRFIYTAAAARKDRFLEEKNENQHYLSVINLSATYNIKLKNKKFALGLEPYIKIPISGIGEGSVPLKSSGISLKLNYELNKKK